MRILSKASRDGTSGNSKIVCAFLGPLAELEADPLVHEVFLQVVHGPLQGAFHRLGGFHLQDKMHPPLQVESEMDLVRRKVFLPGLGKIGYVREGAR